EDLGHHGWVAQPEVSFAIWGERGVIDVLAWHAPTRSLLVVELKTAIVDVGELLGTLDRKVRLGPQVARQRGWVAARVGVALLVGDGSTNRRRIGAHAATFRAALPHEGRQWRRWVRDPVGELRAVAFVSDDRPGNLRSAFAMPQRVATRRAPRSR